MGGQGGAGMGGQGGGLGKRVASGWTWQSVPCTSLPLVGPVRRYPSSSVERIIWKPMMGGSSGSRSSSTMTNAT